jgi:hypothetical protein
MCIQRVRVAYHDLTSSDHQNIKIKGNMMLYIVYSLLLVYFCFSTSSDKRRVGPYKNIHLSFNALAPIASHSSLLIHISPKLSKLQITEAPFQHTNLGFKPRGGGTIATWSEGIPLALRRGGSLLSALPAQMGKFSLPL